MCRWGCPDYESVGQIRFDARARSSISVLQTYMCKFCGTRYCSECLHGDFYGLMDEADHCRKCNQVGNEQPCSVTFFADARFSLTVQVSRQTRRSGGVRRRHGSERLEEVRQRQGQSFRQQEVQEEMNGARDLAACCVFFLTGAFGTTKMDRERYGIVLSFLCLFELIFPSSNKKTRPCLLQVAHLIKKANRCASLATGILTRNSTDRRRVANVNYE